MAGEDSADLEGTSITTTTTLRRRTLPRPLLWLMASAACIGLAALAVSKSGTNAPPEPDIDPSLIEIDVAENASATSSSATSSISPLNFNPLPFDLPSVFVQLQRGDEVLGVVVNPDGSYTTTDFGKHPAFPDANGTHAAYIDEDGVLWAGPLNDIGVVEAWASAFVWHDTVPGSLLYSTQSPDGRPEVVRWSSAEPGRDRQLVGVLKGDPSWFGRSGFSLAGLDGVVMRNDQGDFVRRLPAGNLMSESPDGVVYFTGEIDSMVVDATSGQVSVPSYLRAKRLVGTALSPDGQAAALLSQRSRRELFIVTQGAGADIVHITDFPWSGTSLTWASDNETLGFVTDPNQPQVGFIDIHQASITTDPKVHTYNLALLGAVMHVRLR